jgi:hypothetical protein
VRGTWRRVTQRVDCHTKRVNCHTKRVNYHTNRVNCYTKRVNCHTKRVNCHLEERDAAAELRHEVVHPLRLLVPLPAGANRLKKLHTAVRSCTQLYTTAAGGKKLTIQPPIQLLIQLSH